MNFEDSFFILKLNIKVNERGGIITRELLPSDGPCEQQERYVLFGWRGVETLWGSTLSRSIGNEAGAAGIASLPPFKDDGYYRFYDDAELVLKSIKQWATWLRKASINPNKETKKKLHQWQTLLMPKIPEDGWEKTKASMIGMPVKKRSELSPLAKDHCAERDFHAVRSR